MNKNIIYRWIAIENIVTLLIFGAIVIFAPGAWKWCGMLCLLNINMFLKDKESSLKTKQTNCPKESFEIFDVDLPPVHWTTDGEGQTLEPNLSMQRPAYIRMKRPGE